MESLKTAYRAKHLSAVQVTLSKKMLKVSTSRLQRALSVWTLVACTSVSSLSSRWKYDQNGWRHWALSSGKHLIHTVWIVQNVKWARLITADNLYTLASHTGKSVCWCTVVHPLPLTGRWQYNFEGSVKTDKVHLYQFHLQQFTHHR